jgi:hypothetical protein
MGTNAQETGVDEMKYTVCPPGPEPKRVTASCPEAVRRLAHSSDLTIVQKAQELIPRFEPVPFIDKVRAMQIGGKK